MRRRFKFLGDRGYGGLTSAAVTSAGDTADNNVVLGETLRPLLTHAMGSAVEVFDTSGPAGAGRRLTATRGKRSTSSCPASSRLRSAAQRRSSVPEAPPTCRPILCTATATLPTSTS